MGRWRRNANARGWLIGLLAVIVGLLLLGADLFGILVLVERGEFDEGAVGAHLIPMVEADDESVDVEEEVVVRLLESLCDSVQFTLVAAAVVGLRLARHGADEVRVDTHGEAHHVYRFDDVRSPVATLLVRLNLVDHHVMLLLAVGRHIERGEEHLSAVLHASEDVDEVVLLLVDTLLLLDAVRDALHLEDVVPEGVGYLYVVLDGSRVFEFRLLRDADELLDVVPLTLEEGGVVRDWVIGAVGCGDSAEDGKLFDFLGSCLEVSEWRLGVEEFDALHLVRTDRVAPVGIEDVRYVAAAVSRGEADVARFLAEDAHYLVATLVKDDDADSKAEVLEVLAHTEKITCEVVVSGEVVYGSLRLCGGLRGVVGESAAVAHLGVEHLTGGEGLVRLDKVDDVVWHHVVATPWHVLHPLIDDDRCDVVLLLEDLGCLGGEGGGCAVGGEVVDPGERKIAHKIAF